MSHVREEEEEACCDVFSIDTYYVEIMWIVFMFGIVISTVAIGAIMFSFPKVTLKDNAALSVPVDVAHSDSTPLRSLYLSKASLPCRQAPFLKNSSETLEEIDRYSTLEVKTVAIGEIVVQSKNHDLLTTYVHDVLKHDSVLSDAHKEAVHALVKLSPPEALVNLVEIGEKGTLRNSEVMAMIKHHEDHIHFMLVGVRAEPRLGWKFIFPAARNSWNGALSRLVAYKVRAEASAHLMDTPLQKTKPHARAAKVGT